MERYPSSSAIELENRLDEISQQSVAAPIVNKDELLRLAEDLPDVWESPLADSNLKQRIIRTLIEEIVADVDELAQEVVLVIHWAGGRHSELRIAKTKTGRHGRCTKLEAVEIVRQMAGSYTDEEIALTLNRLGLRTGVGNTWNEVRLRSLRSYLNLPAHRPELKAGQLNLQEAARQLDVSATVVYRLIEQKILPATQIVAGAPWRIDATIAASSVITNAAVALKNRDGKSRRLATDERALHLPGFFEGSAEDLG